MRGKAEAQHAAEDVTGDHPRLCGEKFGCVFVSSGGLGSPPPMRGKEHLSILGFLLLRITPAYAGKSCLCNASCETAEDHPRLCGEKFSMSMVLLAVEGSPPPMRGKVPVLSALGYI